MPEHLRGCCAPLDGAGLLAEAGDGAAEGDNIVQVHGRCHHFYVRQPELRSLHEQGHRCGGDWNMTTCEGSTAGRTEAVQLPAPHLSGELM